MRILITGANGFVGQELVKKLTAHDLTFLTRHNTPSQHKIRLFNSIDDIDFEEALTDIDVVIHLAGLAHQTGRSVKIRDSDFHKINTIFTKNLASSASSMGVKHFIFMSTLKVHGEYSDVDKIFKATDTPRPIGPYAVSKLEAEKFLWGLENQSKMIVSIVRPPLVYGPGVRANFKSLLLLSRYSYLFPTFEAAGRRSMVSIWNLCHFIEKLVDNRPSKNRIYMVSDDDDCTTFQLISYMRNALALNTKAIHFNETVLKSIFTITKLNKFYDKLYRPSRVDISETCELLDWRPVQTTQQEIEKLVRVQFEKNEKF